MARFYVDRRMPDGKRVPIKPGGRRYFGRPTLRYVQARAKRLGHKLVIGRVDGPRDRMRGDMSWALNHEPGIRYRQWRPIPYARWGRHALPIHTDCSGSSACIAKVAGLPDINGRRYDGSGYTGTVRGHLPKRAKVSDCKVGDPIVYGSGTGAHMVLVYSPGPDPLCFSHGQENGPRLYRHSMYLRMHGVFTCHDVTGG